MNEVIPHDVIDHWVVASPLFVYRIVRGCVRVKLHSWLGRGGFTGWGVTLQSFRFAFASGDSVRHPVVLDDPYLAFF